jgi:hypothetical protein
VLVPWLITHWHEGTPDPVVLQALGVVLIAASGMVLVVA